MGKRAREKCERRGCIKNAIMYVSWAERSDGTKGMNLCRKHEQELIRAKKNIQIKDMYDE